MPSDVGVRWLKYSTILGIENYDFDVKEGKTLLTSFWYDRVIFI